MPWHLSKSDPRKVYDSRHVPVCVCQNSDQAALIVRAVTALGPQEQSIRLREPSVPQGKESPEEQIPITSGVSEQPQGEAPLDTWEPEDTCCGKNIAKACRAGLLKSLQSWTCPACETPWLPHGDGRVRYWTPQSTMVLFGGRRG